MLDVVNPVMPKQKSLVVARGAPAPLDGHRLEPAPSVPLISRDAFVAETGIKLDQMQVELRALRRDIESVHAKVAEVREDTDQNLRFHRFLERECKMKGDKTEELMRRYRELQARINAIEGRSGGDYHAYMSFEAVSKRLTELGDIERKYRLVERNLKISAGLFCASVGLWVLTLAAGQIF